MKTFVVTITMDVAVTLDEAKFTPEFLRGFRENFHDLHTLQDHAEHLAEMAVDGRITVDDPDYVLEGYGRLGEAGVSVSFQYMEVEVGFIQTD